MVLHDRLVWYYKLKIEGYCMVLLEGTTRWKFMVLQDGNVWYNQTTK